MSTIPAKPVASVRGLMLALIAAIAITAGIEAVIAGMVSRAAIWAGWNYATVISCIATAFSLPPLLLGMRRGLHATMGGYFAGAILRAAASFGLAVITIVIWRAPAASTVLFTFGYYLAVLIAETSVLAQAMWRYRVTSA